MFIVYYLFCFLESRLRARFPRLPSWLPIALLFLISLCFYDTCYQPKYFSWASGHRGGPSLFMRYSSLGQLFMYFPFFLYGNIVRRYWGQAQRLMDTRYFYPVIVTLVIFAALDCLKWHTLHLAWAPSSPPTATTSCST